MIENFSTGICLLVSFIALSTGQSSLSIPNRDAVSTAFVNSSIVPAWIKIPPSEILQVTFPSGSVANLGNELKPAATKDRPTVQWNAQSGDLYMLVTIDLDAPSTTNNSNSPILHWLVANIPGSDVQAGEWGFDYSGPKPPKSSGLHRYVQLIYKQHGRVNAHEDKLLHNAGTIRRKYPFSELLQTYNLGDPLAGNFFRAQWDESIPPPTAAPRQGLNSGNILQQSWLLGIHFLVFSLTVSML